MTSEGAQLMLEAARAASGRLDLALAAVERAESDEHFKRQRTAVGRVVGSIYFEILEPIISEDPDLAPDWWRFRATKEPGKKRAAKKRR